MVGQSIRDRMPGKNLCPLLAMHAVLVEDLLQIVDLCLSAPEGEPLATVVAVVVELLADDRNAGAALEQRPDHVEVVGTRQADLFVHPPRVHERLLPEEKEVLQIRGLPLEGGKTL